MASIYEFKKDIEEYMDKLSHSTKVMNDTVAELHNMGDLTTDEYINLNHKLAVNLGKIEACLDIYNMVQKKNIKE